MAGALGNVLKQVEEWHLDDSAILPDYEGQREIVGRRRTRTQLACDGKLDRKAEESTGLGDGQLDTRARIGGDGDGKRVGRRWRGSRWICERDVVGQGRDARGLVVDRDRSDGERDREKREKRAHGRGKQRDGIYMAGQLPYMDEINSFRLLFFHVARRRRLSAQLGSRTQLDRKLLKSLGRPRLHHRSSLSPADRCSAEHDTAVGDHPRIARTMV